MKVRFLQEYGKDPDFDIPLYEKGEIVYLFDNFAEQLISQGVVEKI